MANKVRLARKADMPALLTLADGTEWLMPALADIIALPADAIGTGKIGTEPGGMDALSVSETFKLVDVTAADGSPVLVTATVSFKRTAITEGEAERVAKAVKAQENRSHASKLAKAQERTELVQASVATFKAGIESAKATPANDIGAAVTQRILGAVAERIDAAFGPTRPALPAASE